MTVSRGSRPTIVSIGHLHPRRVSRRLRRDVMSRPVHPDLRDVWLTFPVTLRLFRCKLCVLQPTLVAEIHRAISKWTPKELRDNINQTTLRSFSRPAAFRDRRPKLQHVQRVSSRKFLVHCPGLSSNATPSPVDSLEKVSDSKLAKTGSIDVGFPTSRSWGEPLCFSFALRIF